MSIPVLDKIPCDLHHDVRFPFIGLDKLNRLLFRILINSGSSALIHKALAYAQEATTYYPLEDPANFNVQLDRVARKLSLEFYLDNDLEETDPIVVYDDDEAFWSVFNYGEGSYGMTLSEETTEKVKGTSSLKMEVGAGAFETVGIQHVYGSDQDWSAKEFLCFWLYGNNTGCNMSIVIFAPDSSNKFHLYGGLSDNWTGWKRLVIPLRTFTETGSPSWATVRAPIIYYTANQTFTSYLDRTVVDVGQWVHVEVFVPDLLNQGSPNYSVKLTSWNGSAWRDFIRWDDANAVYLAFDLYYLNGDTSTEIYGDKFDSLYPSGKRSEQKNEVWGFGTGRPTTITYSSYFGCLKRIGFALKMPPDDGQDSSTDGISQCKLKLEVFYRV